MRMNVFQLAGGICFWMAIFTYLAGDSNAAGGLFMGFILNIFISGWISNIKRKERIKRRKERYWKGY